MGVSGLAPSTDVPQMYCPDLAWTSKDACAFIPWDVAWGGRDADDRLAAFTTNADRHNEARLLDTATPQPRPSADQRKRLFQFAIKVCAIAGGASNKAPNAPIPPPWATAAAKPTGLAPAIGAIRIGVESPGCWANSWARDRQSFIDQVSAQSEIAA
jgi:hypothetical protein